MVWAVVLPVAALVGIGTVRVPVRSGPGARARATVFRVALCVVAVAVGVVACVRVAAIPPLARAGDPHVARLAALVSPAAAGRRPGWPSATPAPARPTPDCSTPRSSSAW